MLAFVRRQFRGKNHALVAVDASEEYIVTRSVSEFCLLNIPAAVLGPRLLPFLTIKDTARLDSATMCRDLRKHLHDSFVGTNIFIPDGTEQFLWFAARQCCTEYLSMHKTCSMTSDMVLEPSFKSIKCLELSSESICAEVLTALLHNCEQLTTLHLQCTDVDWAKCTIIRTLNLKILDAMGNTTVTDQFMTMILEHSPRLQVLNICNGVITPRILHTAAGNCTELSSLYAWHAFESFDEAVIAQNEAGMSDVLTKCTQLHTLTACVYTATGFFSLHMCCVHLVKLSLSGSSRIGAQDTAIARMAQCCPNIGDLSLSHFEHCTDAGMYTIAQHLPQLHTLALFELYRITDDGVSAILSACAKLTKLNFYSCSDIEHDCLAHTTALTSLQLHTSILNEEVLCEAAQQNCNLRELSVVIGKSIDQWHVIPLEPTCLSGAVVHLSQLREFHYCSIEKNTKCINDMLLCALGQYCPLLTSLYLYNLYRVKGVTNTGGAALASLHQLRTIILQNCPKLGNRAVCAIAQGCPDLYKVSFARCSGVRSEGVRALAQYCHKLEHVNLIGCTWIREYALLELLHNARYLKEVLLSNAVIAKLPQCRWEESAF